MWRNSRRYSGGFRARNVFARPYTATLSHPVRVVDRSLTQQGGEEVEKEEFLFTIAIGDDGDDDVPVTNFQHNRTLLRIYDPKPQGNRVKKTTTR